MCIGKQNSIIPGKKEDVQQMEIKGTKKMI